jgi:hypothetical protein
MKFLGISQEPNQTIGVFLTTLRGYNEFGQSPLENNKKING